MNFPRTSTVVIVSVLVPLMSCGGAEPNAADRLFVAEMIPHHHLGMELVDQATRRVDDTRLRRLVFEMSSYHVSELEQLHEWAKKWNVEPAVDFPGDITKSELADLAALDGRNYDLRWLELMIEHHEGALEISERQIIEGSNDTSIDMAETVDDVQRREIADMEDLLGDISAMG
jgi:uncharacterized protein (DUF305 family)